MVVPADAAHRSKILRRDKQRFPVLEIAGGGLLTSKAHKTAHESVAANWSCKQIEPRVKSLVNVCLILAVHYPCEATGVVAGGRGRGGHGGLHGLHGPRTHAGRGTMLQPHATMCCFSSGRLIEGNNKTRSCLKLPVKHENIVCSINSDCYELFIVGRGVGASLPSRYTYMKVRC